MLRKLHPVFTTLLLAGGCAATPPQGEHFDFTGKVQCAHCDLEIVPSGCREVVTNKGKHYFLIGKKSDSFFKKFPKTKTVRVTGRARPYGKHTSVSVETIEKR